MDKIWRSKKDRRKVFQCVLIWNMNSKNKLFGPAKHLTMENKRNNGEFNFQFFHLEGTDISNPLGTESGPSGPSESASLKAKGEGHSFHQVNVIHYAYPPLYCGWVRDQPMPWNGFFFPVVIQITNSNGFLMFMLQWEAVGVRTRRRWLISFIHGAVFG